MKQFNTYIFDLDGTLLDTLGDLAASTNFALEQTGMPQRTIDEVRQFVGNGVRNLMRRAVPQGEDNPLFMKAFIIFQQHYLQHGLDTTKPYPGIMQLLDTLKANGKKVAVVSNKFQTATAQLCSHFFGPLVDVAIGERPDVRRKPAPDTVLTALAELNAETGGAVYIGDSDVDIETARNCGLPCVSVLWGFRDREFLIQNGADTLIDSPADLLWNGASLQHDKDS